MNLVNIFSHHDDPTERDLPRHGYDSAGRPDARKSAVYTFDDMMVAALCGGLVVAVVAGVTAVVEVVS